MLLQQLEILLEAELLLGHIQRMRHSDIAEMPVLTADTGYCCL